MTSPGVILEWSLMTMEKNLKLMETIHLTLHPLKEKRIAEWEVEWKSNDDDDTPTPVPSDYGIKYATSVHPHMPPMSMVGGGFGATGLGTPMGMQPVFNATSSMMPGPAFSTLGTYPQVSPFGYATSYVGVPPPAPSHVASYVGQTYPHPHHTYAASEMMAARGPFSVVGSYMSGSELASECYPQESASNVGRPRRPRKERKEKREKGERNKKKTKKRSSSRKPREEVVEEQVAAPAPNLSLPEMPSLQTEELFPASNVEGKTDEWDKWVKEGKM